MSSELKSFDAIRKSVENDSDNNGFFTPEEQTIILGLMDTPRKKMAALEKIAEYCNGVLNNPPGDLETSLFDYAWCGKITKETPITVENGRCFIDGLYCDLDECSYALYTWMAGRCNRKIRGNPVQYEAIKDFEVAVRGTAYMLALKVNLKNGKSVLLSGDWLIDWKSAIDSGLDIKRLHTIKWHTMWPCRQINGMQTINQLRRGIDLQTTLEVLKHSYQRDFEGAKEDLAAGFSRYKEWFLLFGKNEEGYKNYIDFWELDIESLSI